jgi:hypothetical protein
MIMMISPATMIAPQPMPTASFQGMPRESYQGVMGPCGLVDMATALSALVKLNWVLLPGVR